MSHLDLEQLNNKFDEVNEKHNKYRINATKNMQIVENKYRSKIRRHLNKIESRIKQYPKNNNQPTDERTRTQTQKILETTNTTKNTTTKFSENAQFSPKNDPKNCSIYVDILYPRTRFSLFKENPPLDDPT